MKCPCCSGNMYQECCAPLHEGGFADSPLQLMRSRYSAYVLGKVDYIIRTTHPKNVSFQKDSVKWALDILSFCQNTQFEKLEIVEANGNTVSFVAHLRQGGQEVLLRENSTFKKEGPQWLYHFGLTEH